MMRRALLTILLCGGCVAGTAGDEGSDPGEGSAAISQNGLLYFYVTPAAPGSQGGPLALRRANAVPGLLDPTYGLATLPAIRLASDATTTQAALDYVLSIPYAGNETNVVALLGGRDATSVSSGPLEEVVELYLASGPIAVGSVQQKDVLYQIRPSNVVRLVNEKDYSSSSSLTVDAPDDAARQAVLAGDMFTGSIDQHCSKILWFTRCDPPSAVHVGAYFTAY